MTREVARRLIFLLRRAKTVAMAAAVAAVAGASCYPGGGGGSDPPTNTFYFPVGLAVSSGGNALYVVNSDFDLQWNGGTLQSYDLFAIRGDTAKLIQTNLSGQAQSTISPPLPFVSAAQTTPCAIGLPTLLSDAGPPTLNNNDGSRIQLGQGCAPPVNTTIYQRSSAIIGAFATDLQLQVSLDTTRTNGNLKQLVGTRLFAPVRGDATVTWADVKADNPSLVPASDLPGAGGGVISRAAAGVSPLTTDIYTLDCGQGGGNQCNADHKTGNVVDANDTRMAIMPGEPFGMAQTPDGTAIAVTHQTSTQTSLLLAGRPPAPQPSMQFVVTDMANAGKGITAVPHDPDAPQPPCELLPPGATNCVNPAFLETNGSSPELDLLRYYSDDNSSLSRPFMSKEGIFPFNTDFAGTDSRGIVIDPTPRMQCKVQKGPAFYAQCALLPARIFFANRTPPTLVFATIGSNPANTAGGYDPDLVTFSTGNLPIPAGPSRVYLAPIINLEGNYELRVFVVNFDSATISVFNPNLGPELALMDTIYVGPGPFAMAFDPFSLEDVAAQTPPPPDHRYDPSLGLTSSYRFAYVASFSQSFVQVIDLDQSKPTFESVVYTLGAPTPPKGTAPNSGSAI
jgi:hypothetical protein